jgi:hypothetical protein
MPYYDSIKYGGILNSFKMDLLSNLTVFLIFFCQAGFRA